MMKESAQAALSYVRSRSKRFNIDDKVFENNDVTCTARPESPRRQLGRRHHRHRDLSAITRIPVHREVAMTGEVTLRAACCRSAVSKRRCSPPTAPASKTVLFPWGKSQGTSKRSPQGSRRGSPHAREARRRDPQGRAGDGEA